MNTKTTTITTSDDKKGSASKPPAKKKGPSMLETISSLRMRTRHILWICAWALVTITVAALVAIFLVSRISGDEDTNHTVVTEIRLLKETTSNGFAELKGAVNEASKAGTEAQLKAVENLNAKSDAKTVEVTNALTALQVANTNGLDGVKTQVKESGDASKASIDSFGVMLAKTQAELAALKAATPVITIIDPSRPAEPVASQTNNLNLIPTIGVVLHAQERILDRSAPIEKSVWIKIMPGTISRRYSRDDIVSKRIQLDDTEGIEVISYEGWPSRRIVGQHPVTTVIPIERGARSIAFTHPTTTFYIRVNR